MDQSSEKKFRGEGRVQFLTHKDTIRQEIEQGWSVTAVYERHKAKLNISYMQFSRYVQRFITGTPEKKTPQQAVANVKPKPEAIPTPRPQPKTRLNDPAPLPDSELF